MEFIDLKSQYRHLKKKIDSNINQVLEDAQFILGNIVEEFENQLAEYVGTKYCVTCSDGTAALQLIYMAIGLQKGDVVFCPDMTFIASVEPACMLGATPVFCDIERKTYNIDTDSLERQIKNVIDEGKMIPKAIVAVDFVGNPADYDALDAIAKKYGLVLIEDAAQGIGASYKKKKCGSFGDIAATSFFPSKPLGCYGDGGAVFTNSDEMNSLLRSLRVHGKGKSKYDNVRIGINSRLDAIQAAVLKAKLEELPREIETRQEIARKYNEALKEMFQVPYIEDDSISSYAQYILKVKNEQEREECFNRLKTNNIPFLLYYPTPMHMLPVFKDYNMYGEKFDVTCEYSKTTFGIPFSPYIAEKEQELVIETLLNSKI